MKIIAEQRARGSKTKTYKLTTTDIKPGDKFEINDVLSRAGQETPVVELLYIDLNTIGLIIRASDS